MLKLARRSRNLSVDGRRALQYDEFSRLYRMRDMESYAELAAARVPEGGSVLDVATGPGYFCIALAAKGPLEVTGLDISEDLVEIARGNARREGADVTYLVADASSMPLPDSSFDLVFCSWAVKNFMDPVAVLGEMHRVLKPGGSVLIVDVDHDASTKDWDRYASRMGLRRWTALAMGLAFMIQRSGAYTRAQFEALVASTPLCLDEVHRSGIDLVISLTK